MVPKLLIGLLVGFVIGGGMTYFGYAEEIDNFVNEITEFNPGIGVKPSSNTSIESNSLMKDCSGFETLSSAWWDCSRYNQDITQEKHNKEVLEERKSIARGF